MEIYITLFIAALVVGLDELFFPLGDFFVFSDSSDDTR